MSKTLSLVAVLGLLCVAGPVLAARPDGAGKPPPIEECPTDVAAAVAEACPCDGRVLPNDTVQPWKNHGQYVSCAVRFRNALRKAGCLDAASKKTIARCAARSTCGKPGLVLCCEYVTGTCNDPAPGDATAAGTCSQDAALACDIDADCTVGSSSIAKDDATCVASGGTSVGGGSVCAACPPPPPPAE